MSLEARKAVLSALPEMSNEVKSVSELKTDEIKRIAYEKIKENVLQSPQQYLFANEIIREAQTHMRPSSMNSPATSSRFPESWLPRGPR